jgi:hypothetical protein
LGWRGRYATRRGDLLVVVVDTHALLEKAASSLALAPDL